MKRHYISAKKFSIWMRLVNKWNKLYLKVQEWTNFKSLKKLNKLSLLLGVKRKIMLTTIAGLVTLGAQAQMVFEEVADRRVQVFREPLAPGRNAIPEFTDVDGDGDEDLVVGVQDGTLKFYENTPTGYVERTDTDNPFWGIDVFGGNSSPAFIDVDGDGDQDIVIGRVTSGDLWYYKKSVTGYQLQLASSGSPFEDINVPHSRPTFYDVDEDGNQDLIVGAEDGTIKCFISNGTSYTEQTGSSIPVSLFS